MRARELAYKVGCAVGAIYNVFTDLDDLIFAVNALTLEQLEKTLTVAGEQERRPAGRRDPDADPPGARLHGLRGGAPAALARAVRPSPRRGQGRSGLVPWRTSRRLFVYIEEPLRRLAPDMAPLERMLLARSLFSAVHGIVLIGLEEKLQSIPLATVRAQVTFMVEAFAKGLARQQQ